MRVFYLFLLNIFIANGQEIVLQGTLILNNHSLENIHIINLSNKKTAISDVNGKFIIEAKEDDLLVFSAIHIDYWRQSVNENDIKNKTIIVKLTPKTQILEEVVVEQKVEITAQEMGIINYTPKTYTPAERRLRTANSGPIEIISSWITGKNKMLKKNIEIERNIKYQEQILALYNKEFFTETLKIPEIYRDGFVFYVVEMPEMIAALDSKDQLKIKFMVSDLATDFLKFIEEN